MSLKEFLLSKIFLKNLGFALAIFAGILMVLLIWLNFYTRHGQARPVPDFYGLTMAEAENLAEKNKLRFEVIDSVYTTLVPRGCVAEQSPKPGFKVKKGRNVVFTLNAFNPEMVKVPNLIDLPIRQALAMIESSGLKMGDPRYKPDLSINIVIEQLHNGKNISEGDSLQKGSVIDLVLGKGLSNQRTSVPDLIGMNLEPARKKILMSALSLGTYLYDNTVVNTGDSLRAFVYKQNPEFRQDASMQLGSDIYLWLTTDSAKKTVSESLNTDSIPEISMAGEASN